jgi:hypothetical protein
VGDTTNHVVIANISLNSSLDSDEANSTLDSWEGKSDRIRPENVRDEALDSFALAGLRSTYISGRPEETRTYSDVSSAQHVWRGWQGHVGGTVSYRLAPLQPASTSPDWNRVDMGWRGLRHTGRAIEPVRSGERPVFISFPLHDDPTHGTYNNMNRWVIYCSCEMFIERPRAMEPNGDKKCPTVELALARKWTDSTTAADTILDSTRRGFGIGDPPDWMCGPLGGSSPVPEPKGTIPTSLSYSVVHYFDPFEGDGTTHARSGENVNIYLMGRYEDGRDFHVSHKKNRFYWSAMNISLFAVNYRR